MSDGLTLGRSAPRAAAPVLALLGDDRLARLTADGSSAAFSAIYRRHHQAIYRYCLSIVGNEHDARDALQETMASALRALAGSEREIALRPWLFRIAHNEAVTVLRRKRRETPVDDLAVTADDDGTETRDDLRELLDDLGLLTARQRSALVMRELNGLSFAEIGVALDVSAEGAKQAVYEGRCGLRDLRAGRALECTEVRKKISAEDRRLLRGRQVRAHLKACAGCRDFAEEINQRRTSLAALAPLPGPAAFGILQSLLGGGSGGGGIAVGTGASLAGIAKLGIAGVIAVGVGAGAIEVRDHARGDSTAAAEERGATPTPATPETGDADAVVPATSTGGTVDAAKGSAHGGRADKPGGDGSEGSSTHSPAADPASGNGAGGAGGAGGGATPAEPTDSSPAASDNTTVAATTEETTHNPNGNGPASTPAGHGGTPPGQGGDPPGLGAPTPGHGGTPPGQSTTDPPGNSENAPGQTGQTPSNGASPPGQTPSEPPGSSGDAPGHSGPPPGDSSGG